ncbi:MAG: ABC transporter permease [Verrucomicrobia bacterium]|nr:ABC transporter permease [Verrucomicrobiota bacterium]
MDIVRIAWRNIGRNKRRSVLTALAVAFACTVLVFSMALQRGSYADMIRNTVHAHTGNLQVQRTGYWPDRDIARKLTGSAAMLNIIDHTEHVVAAAPRVNGAALVSYGHRTFGAALFGTDPEREKGVSTLADVITEGSYLDKTDVNGALVGYVLAKNLGAEVGDEIVFLGQGADGSIAASTLIIKGLIKRGVAEMDRTAVFAHIETIQEAFSLYGGISEIAVLLDDDKYRPETVRQLESALRDSGHDDAAVLGWPAIMPGIEQSIKLDWSSGIIIYSVLVLVVGFGIANTFLMAFMERIHEFGVLKALGMRPAGICVMVYVESLLLTAIGILAGTVTGSLIVLRFQHTGIDFGYSDEMMAEYGLDPIIHPQLSTLVLAWAVGIVLVIAMLVAIYPAVKAATLKPVEALRHR